MPKKSAGTRIESEIYKRLERIAQVDRRTVANVIEICVLEYLPKLEAEILHEDSRPIEHPEPKPVRYPSLRTAAKK